MSDTVSGCAGRRTAQTTDCKRNGRKRCEVAGVCDNLCPTARKLLIPKRRDVRVVEGARLEIALTVCDGVLQISITVADPGS